MTEAPASFHVLSQIVPQVLLTHTSTRPRLGLGLPTIRTSPSVQSSIH